MPTVREIAEFANVSKSTVSLVLNNKPGVSNEMRQLVLDAVSHLQAQEDHNEVSKDKSADSGRVNFGAMMSIVVLHPPVLRSSHVFSEVLQGIQTAAQTYNVQLRLVMNDRNASEGHVSHMYITDPNLRPDGVLVFGAQQNEPLLEIVSEQNIPCVVLGREVNKYDVSGIGRSETRYGYLAAKYLLELGHSAIAFVGGQPEYDYLHNRQNGYTQALEDAGVYCRKAWVQIGNGAEATEAVLEKAPEVTGMIYVNDSYASEGLAVLEDKGIAIPDAMSIISFDDTQFAQDYDPPLTSIYYNRFEEGKWAVKMLIDQIRFPYLERVQTIFRAQLVERASCAPPRNS